MIDNFDTKETDALHEGGGIETKVISDSMLSGSAKEPVIDISKPFAGPAEHHKNAKDSTDTHTLAHVKTKFATETIKDEETSDALLTQSHSEEYQQRKFIKSRLSRAVTKLKNGVHNYFIPDIEKLSDRNYTQEELLQLVKVAEAEVLKEKLEKLKEEGITPAAAEEIGAIDIEELAQTASELTGKIGENETTFSEILDKEKKGERINNAELLTLWKERGELMTNLFDVAGKQTAYINTLTNKATQAFVQQLFAPMNKLLLKMWNELNRKNPNHVALPELRSAVYAKMRKTHIGEWGLREEHQYRQWRKAASPADFARRITEKQTVSTNFALAA
jgi:hypothetical protein